MVMGTVMSIRSEQDAEDRTLEGLRALIEREIDRRVRPLEELLQAKSGEHITAEEYLDIEALALRIHTEPGTIRDWVYKKRIPFQKLPTGGIRFPWSQIDAWIKGGQP